MTTKLSKNLTLEEVIRSATATKNGLSNIPDVMHVINLTYIANDVFQPLRDAIGPIICTSGYRGRELNALIGGASTSQHTKGMALDLVAINETNKGMFNYIAENLNFDQLIWEYGTLNEPEWVHVSYDKFGNNRRELLIAYKNKEGETKYKPYEL